MGESTLNGILVFFKHQAHNTARTNVLLNDDDDIALKRDS